MLTLVLAVTPLMFLRNMTSLKPVALIGMTTIAALACCIAVRSYQCNFCDNGTSATSENQSSDGDVGEVIIPEREENWWEYATLCGTPKGILNSLPIFICTFVCHFNVLPVHGELRKPTRKRLKKMVHITFGITAFFYTFVGVAGSMFGNCTDGEGVNGNILVNFANDDNLMTVGRFGLMCTITLAFPNLVMPCRDILFRALKTFLKGKKDFGLDDTIHGSSDRPSDGRRTSLTKNGKSDNDEGDDGELTGDNGDENDLSAPLLNSTPFVNNNATNSSNRSCTSAATRIFGGKPSGYFPPIANPPQGAPKANANCKTTIIVVKKQNMEADTVASIIKTLTHVLQRDDTCACGKCGSFLRPFFHSPLQIP